MSLFSGFFKSTNVYELGSYKVAEEEKISEGGYAYVFRVSDVKTGKKYALKKIMLHDEQQEQMLEGEITLWRKLGDHPNIVKMYETAILQEDTTKYLLVLMELCTGGHLINLLEKFKGELIEKQIVFILKDIVEGVRHMHSMKPPIAHRDLKVENILLENKRFKICDFGSATTETLDYVTASKAKLAQQIDGFERFTTLMYRPPEMIDSFFKYPVSEKVDIWMLGCIAYSLCYFKHPFQEGQKLGIVNAFYHFPESGKGRISEKMQDFVRIMLTPDPRIRPNILQIQTILENWEKMDSIKLNEEAQKIKEKQNKALPKKTAGPPKIEGDLTPEDIARLQEKIRKDQAAKAKPYQKAGLIDWTAAEAPSTAAVFDKPKQPEQKKEASLSYFDADFF